MIVRLHDTYLADGVSREHRVAAQESFSLNQQNQTSLPGRAAWNNFFHSRAARSINLNYPVTLAPCATLGEAAIQARTVAVDCPKGGILYEHQEGEAVIYEDAQVTSIQVERSGVTNVVRYSLEAKNPRTARLILDEDGVALEDGDGVPLEY